MRMNPPRRAAVLELNYGDEWIKFTDDTTRTPYQCREKTCIIVMR